VDENAALRDIETPSRLEDLPLNHLCHRERKLRVRHDLKVVADCCDPHKGRQEGEVLGGNPLDCVSDGAKEGVSANREIEGAGRITLLNTRTARAHQLSVPYQRRLASVSPHIVAEKPRDQSRYALEGTLPFLRVEGIVQVHCQESLASVEGALCPFGSDLAAEWDANPELDWLHRWTD
jgi:hypothetical protein